MGVNEHGLVIGNEAVFTRVVDRDGSALLGMDVLRLALERTRAARGAIQCIDNLLSEYGQGGPAGYRNKNFRYDSSFIIADPGEAWILETAGRHWVARRVDGFDAISNALCITDDFELHSEGLHEYARTHTRYRGPGELNFARAFDTFFMRFMGKPERRRACSLETLSSLSPPGLLALAAGLRRHDSDNGDFSRHDNADVCMHAGGLLRPSQTTGSMLVKLAPDTTPEVYVTGTSAPCLSLFQPLSFQACAEEQRLRLYTTLMATSLLCGSNSSLYTTGRLSTCHSAGRCRAAAMSWSPSCSRHPGMSLRAQNARWHGTATGRMSAGQPASRITVFLPTTDSGTA